MKQETILSDFEPKGAVAKRHGVYCQQDGVTERALFVINKDGRIHWSYAACEHQSWDSVELSFAFKPISSSNIE